MPGRGEGLPIVNQGETMKTLMKRIIQRANCQWHTYKYEASLLLLSVVMLLGGYWQEIRRSSFDEVWLGIYQHQQLLPGMF